MHTCTDTTFTDYLLMAFELAVFLILVFMCIRGIQKIITGGIHYVLDWVHGFSRRRLRMGRDKRI